VRYQEICCIVCSDVSSDIWDKLYHWTVCSTDTTWCMAVVWL